jgi:hypothetical protein
VVPGPTTGGSPAPEGFEGVVGPVVALGVSLLLALAVLLAQLLGGAAFVPVVRRSLGELRLRRWVGDPGAPASETAPRRSDGGRT